MPASVLGLLVSLLMLALGPATAEARLPRLANGYELAVKPATVYGWTFDGRQILGGPSSNLPEGYGKGSFGHIHWKLWSGRRARGKGVVWTDDCVPSCGNGTWTGRATRVSAYRVRGGHFTRMKFTSEGAVGHHPHAVFGYRGEIPPEWEILRQWRSRLVAGESIQVEAHALELRARYRRCRNVVIRNGDGSVFTRTHGLFEKRTTCRTARKVAHRYLSFEGEGGPPHPLGFNCSGGSDGVSCRRGRQHVTWGYTYD